ncbi:MAG: threonylcarbamoyl-AMP synthase [Isosphaera sp.]|nr:threonylcarbamoyl-AMP synthase [Isosphaera sp.]
MTIVPQNAASEPSVILPGDDPASIARAVDRLRAGLPVAFPTETVYGLGADALSDLAVQRVYDLKGRPHHNPLIVHVLGATEAQALVPRTGWPPIADALTKALWPGPLTLVLPRQPGLCGRAAAQGPTIALRAPDHPTARDLLRALGRPVVGPSANASGHVSPTTPSHVLAEFPRAGLLILDGGPARAGIESTVLDLRTPSRPAILRPGVITAPMIAAAAGLPDAGIARGPAATQADPTFNTHNAPADPLPSPGMLLRHYAPRAPARLGTRREILHALASTPSAVALWLSPAPPPPAPLSGSARPAHPEPLPPHPEAYAARLYDALRAADALSPALILIETPPTAGPTEHHTLVWMAVHDRLRRATTPDHGP